MPEGGGEVTGRGASTPIETSRGNITADERPLLEAATASELVGLGSVSVQVYSDGLQVVVNLSHRTLSEAENAFLSKGLSFCPTPAEIDVYTLRTEKISAFGDHHLKPLVAAVPSYVKDTNDFLKKLRDISTLPSGAIIGDHWCSGIISPYTS